LLEAGWPLHHVQEMLGHASLQQTSTYLNVQRGVLRESMRRSDESRSGCNPVVIESGTGLPLVHNERAEVSDKPTVN
jgi:Phage integrase family